MFLKLHFFEVLFLRLHLVFVRIHVVFLGLHFVPLSNLDIN